MGKTGRLISVLLCFAIAWTTIVPVRAENSLSLTPAEIRQKYPDARIIRVSRDEYPELASKLARKGYRPGPDPVVRTARAEEGSREAEDSASATSRSAEDCGGTVRHRERESGGSGEVLIDIYDGEVSGGGGGGDLAAVIFVVIGAVVVVVWTIYAIKFLYDLAIGRDTCGAWSDFTVSSAWISGGRNVDARFSGFRYLAGYREGGTDVGIAAEVGDSVVELPDRSLRVRGMYWLVGPMLRWHMTDEINPNYFQMEFLGGSTENEAVGFIAHAKAGVSYGVGEHFRWGLNIGALNLNLNKTEGVVRADSRYYMLYGLEMGYRF